MTYHGSHSPEVAASGCFPYTRKSGDDEMAFFVCPGFPRNLHLIFLKSIAVAVLEFVHLDCFFIGEGSLKYRLTVST